jgi:hypothetical protein
MIALFKELITNQYQASLATAANCIEHCPYSHWNLPVARYPFSQSVFHTLFYADYYLETAAERVQVQLFHRENRELFADYEQLKDIEPTEVYTREQLRTYRQFCQKKVIGSLEVETVESLAAPAQFPRKNFSRAELHVYNIRHIQHHAAQLILRLRLDTDVDVPWYRSGSADFSR